MKNSYRFYISSIFRIAGYGLSGHEAHASETTNVDKAHLVDLAQHNPEELNAKPVQAEVLTIFIS